tara:strand:+ start:230 stop:505 length:276 start_codon:yes stop_codon:yes gene_type:complete
MADNNTIYLKVSGGSQANKVAGSVVKNIDEGKKVVLKAIGAGAVNQMIKSITVARSMIASTGRDMYFTSGFSTEIIEGEEKTCLLIFVFTR